MLFYFIPNQTDELINIIRCSISLIYHKAAVLFGDLGVAQGIANLFS